MTAGYIEVADRGVVGVDARCRAFGGSNEPPASAGIREVEVAAWVNTVAEGIR